MAGVASFLPERRFDVGHAQTGAAQIDPKLEECGMPLSAGALRHFWMAASWRCILSSRTFAASSAAIISRTCRSLGHTVGGNGSGTVGETGWATVADGPGSGR